MTNCKHYGQAERVKNAMKVSCCIMRAEVSSRKSNTVRRTDRRLKRDSPVLSISRGVALQLFEQQTWCSGWVGWAELQELTNCITGHYRCSVIDYLYPYKMSGSLVDQPCLASSDKMFPLNHHTRANNTFRYMRELSDKVLRV